MVLVFEKIQIEMIFALKKITIKYYKNCNNIPNHITKAVTVMLVKNWNNLWKVAEKLSTLDIFKNKIMNCLSGRFQVCLFLHYSKNMDKITY